MQLEAETLRSELGQLVRTGKARGFITYREVNEHLPEELHDTNRLEAVVKVLTECGIDVLESSPAEDPRLLDEGGAEDLEETTEALLLSAIEGDAEREHDLLAMYLGQMASFRLLNRDQEVQLASRIEDGVTDATLALARCPAVVDRVIDLADQVLAGQLRVTDVFASLRPRRPRSGADGPVRPCREGCGGTPTVASVRARVGRLRRFRARLAAAQQETGLGTPEGACLREDLAGELSCVRFTADTLARLSDGFHDRVAASRSWERRVQAICVDGLRIPRRRFAALWTGRETDPGWVQALRAA
jgi:RNA polymerase primary sigma factor